MHENTLGVLYTKAQLMHHQPNVIRENLHWIVSTETIQFWTRVVWQCCGSVTQIIKKKNMITTSLCLQKLVNVWWFLNNFLPPPCRTHFPWPMATWHAKCLHRASSTLLSFWKFFFFLQSPQLLNSTQFYLNWFQIVLLLKLKTNIITQPV